MDFAVRTVWDGGYFLGLILLWLSFFLLSGTLKKVEKSSKKETHWRYFYAALLFFLIKPGVDAYYIAVSGGQANWLAEFLSVFAVFIGSIVALIPLLNLRKMSLTTKIGSDSILLFLSLSAASVYFAFQTQPLSTGISGLLYFAAAIILGMCLKTIADFTESFERLVPLRWLFVTASILIPIALMLRAYSYSILSRFGSTEAIGYVFGEIRVLFIFFLFIAGLMAFIGSYTMRRAVLSESALRK